MVKQQFPSGIISPRDYGLHMRTQGRTIFASPARYAMGLAIVDTPAELEARLAAYEQGEALDDLRARLRENVAERENGCTTLLDVGGKDAMRKVRMFAGTFGAQVRSISGREQPWHETFLGARESKDNLAYFHVGDDSKDSVWSDVKSASVISKYGAALDTALALDRLGRLSSRHNITGLPGARDLPAWPLAFDFVKGATPSSARSRLATDMLVSYYTARRPSYTAISRGALEQDTLYSDAIRNALAQNNAFFGVMRQRRTPSRANSSYSEMRYERAATLLEERIMEKIMDGSRGFSFRGYVLEFKGTPYETVAKRFAAPRANVVYDVCRNHVLTPVIVKRFLGEQIAEIHRSDDVLPNVHPLRRPREGYLSIDDATRTLGMTQVIAPDGGSFNDLPVPGILKERYELLRK